MAGDGDKLSPLTPVLGPEQKKLAMWPPSTVHGGQYATKYVTIEYQLHASFMGSKLGAISVNQLVETDRQVRFLSYDLDRSGQPYT